MNNKIGLFIGIAALIIAVTACFLPVAQTVERVVDKVVEKTGALSGPDVYSYLTVHGKFNDGGAYTNASTTMTSALTLTAKQVCESQVISVNSAATALTLSVASLDVTLPGTSTLFTTCLKERGSHTKFMFANLSPTAASTTQIVAGTGGDLMEPDDTSAFDIEIGGLNRAWIEITRLPDEFEANLGVVVTVTEFSPAD